jgi:membrane protein YqaA with SNARE-associated domain
MTVLFRGWKARASLFLDSPYGVWLLAAIAFADSSFLPLMPDFLLVPMMLLRPERSLWLCGVCIVTSSLGALFGYGIGLFFWNTIGAQLVELWGHAAAFEAYQRMVAEWGAWLIIAKAFTPLPFKIVAIAAGVASMNVVTFTISALASRLLHFAMVGFAAAAFGPKILLWAERSERNMWIGGGIVAAAALFYFAIKRF